MYKKLFFLGLFILLCIIYYVALFGQFAVVDDYVSIVTNQEIRNLDKTLLTAHFPRIFFSVLISVFGLNPLPFHLLSLVLHFVNVVLVFYIAYLLFNKRTAFISTALFAVHPINTEAVSWISGVLYLYVGIVTYSSIICYILYIQKKQIKYLWFCLGLILFGLIFIRSVWVFIIPFSLLPVHFILTGRTIFNKKSIPLFLFFVPVIIAVFVFFHTDIKNRLTNRVVPSYANQQSLTPVAESWAYTTATMLRLYIFPRNLTIYYDGSPVTQVEYAGMYVITAIFIIMLVYFYKKDKKITGLLLILPVLIAPTYSPIKVTWFMSERYLYLGSAFYAILAAFFINYIAKKFRYKNLTIVLTLVIIIGYSVRTIVRNYDWKTPETLGLATIRTSPYSVRPYNDLAGYYKLSGDTDKALAYYSKALQIQPESKTAIHNIGLIYIENGLPTTHEKLVRITQPKQILEYADKMYKAKSYPESLFYYKEILEIQPNSLAVKERIGDIFFQTENFDQADRYYTYILSSDENKSYLYEKRAFIAYRKGEYADAKVYLEKYLEFNPTSTSAQQNLELLNNLGTQVSDIMK